MTSFNNVFGNSAVSPSDVAFKPYSISADLVLYWPAFANGQPDVAARFMNITASVGGLTVSIPDASLVSVGYDVIICNKGAQTFEVLDYDGNSITTIATGEVFYLLLNDNSTQAGTWQVVQFGVGTGSAVASALAGAGLVAAAGLLNVTSDVDLQSTDYSITSLSRARLQVWTGGAGIITLPTAASVGDGFFFSLANNGSGSVTVTASGSDTIDDAATSVFTQTQSGFIISSGSNWYTVGKGLQNNFSVTLLNLNVAGNTDITETSSQAQNIIQQYTGILTGNINVIVPNTVQLYYCFNNTSGPYTLTVKTSAGTGYLIPQGEHVIVYCDGTDVVNAFTSNVVVAGTPVYSVGLVGGTADALTANASNFVLQYGTVVFFVPSQFNTGAATLNVQSSGIIEIVKITPSGLVSLQANDMPPGVPIAVEHDGTYWVAISLPYFGGYAVLSTDTVMGAGYLLYTLRASAAINLTLPLSSLFPPYFNTTILASGGAVTLIPDASDSIQGGTAGANYVIPQGGSGKLTTDGAGNWTLMTYNVPAVANDTTTNATMYPTWVTANTGNLQPKVTSTKLTYNPSTGNLSSTVFTGNLTGNVTGNVTGDISGNAATATALQTARNIGGVSFNGTANIVPQTIESANEATDTTCFPLFITASGTQQLQPKNNTGLTFNSNTGAFAATSFAGAFNGTIGATTPAAGAFTTVDTSGTITVTNASPIYAAYENDAAADNGKWQVAFSSARYRVFALTDAGVAGTAGVEFTRSGNTIASQTYTASTSFNFDTGVTNINGGLNVGSGATVTSILSNTASLNFASCPAGSAGTPLTITVTGATVGDTVALGIPSTTNANIIYKAWVSSTNTVSVQQFNSSVNPVDENAQTFRVTVIRI